MTDDSNKGRDFLRGRTPPHGQPRAPTNRGVPEEISFEEPSEVRNAPGPLERIDARVRRMAKDTAASVLTIEGVRTELKGDISDVRDDVKELAKTQTAMLDAIGDLKGDVGAASGQLSTLPAIVQSLVDERKTFIQELSTERHLATKAQISVDKHAKIAEIDDAVDRKKAGREWLTKLLAIVSTIIAGVLAIIHTKGC